MLSLLHIYVYEYKRTDFFVFSLSDPVQSVPLLIVSNAVSALYRAVAGNC